MRRAGLRGLAALPRRTRTTDSRHRYPVAPNRLGRNFAAAAPNQVWLADLTYIPTGEGWLYLAAILGMHTRKLAGWSMRETLHMEIAMEARSMAVERQRPAPGLIHHSDRGIQGGFKRSSQHPDGGGCDGCSEATLGTIWTASIALAWSTASGKARGTAAVLVGDRRRSSERRGCGPGRCVPGCRNTMVPGIRRLTSLSM